jgi:hypothetical protein
MVSLERRRRRRKAESDIFFYIPLPKIEKSKKKFLLCFCPFRRKKKGTKLLTRILFPRQAQDAFTIETNGLRDYIPAKTARNERKTPRGMFFDWFRAIFLGRNRSQNAFSKIENDCILNPSPHSRPNYYIFFARKRTQKGESEREREFRAIRIPVSKTMTRMKKKRE